MNKMMRWSALSLLALAACDRSPGAHNDATQTAPAPIAAQTPAFPPFAPPGVFFLLSKVSVETDSGISSYPAGTKLFKVGARYVTSDGRQLSPRPAQLTNDMHVAERAAGSSPKLQAVVQATIRALQVAAASPIPVQSRWGTTAAENSRQELGPPKLDGDARKSDKSRQQQH